MLFTYKESLIAEMMFTCGDAASDNDARRLIDDMYQYMSVDEILSYYKRTTPTFI